MRVGSYFLSVLFDLLDCRHTVRGVEGLEGSAYCLSAWGLGRWTLGLKHIAITQGHRMTRRIIKVLCNLHLGLLG